MLQAESLCCKLILLCSAGHQPNLLCHIARRATVWPSVNAQCHLTPAHCRLKPRTAPHRQQNGEWPCRCHSHDLNDPWFPATRPGRVSGRPWALPITQPCSLVRDVAPCSGLGRPVPPVGRDEGFICCKISIRNLLFDSASQHGSKFWVLGNLGEAQAVVEFAPKYGSFCYSAAFMIVGPVAGRKNCPVVPRRLEHHIG